MKVCRPKWGALASMFLCSSGILFKMNKFDLKIQNKDSNSQIMLKLTRIGIEKSLEGSKYTLYKLCLNLKH